MKAAFRIVLAMAFGAVVVAVSSCGRGGEQGAYITVKGSDTMVHLVSTWAEEFMARNEGIEVSVTGGGSGTGVAALINETTDLCAASRGMKPREYELAEERGIEPVETAAAMDGIAVVVNPANMVDALTLEQLYEIFTGAVTNWSQVGGEDRQIMVLSRESSSGTYVFFQEHVLRKEDYVTGARLMPATSTIIQATAEDKAAIGYVGLGYAEEASDRVKVLGVKETPDSEPIHPSAETVVSGEYSIARPLFFYSPGQPAGNVKQFVDFCLSPAGQKIVAETGYVPITSSDQ